MDPEDLPDLGEPPHHLPRRVREAAALRHHQGHPGNLRRPHHRLGGMGGQRHRLLDQDMLPGPRRVASDGGM